jgi:hypothetical protein
MRESPPFIELEPSIELALADRHSLSGRRLNSIGGRRPNRYQACNRGNEAIRDEQSRIAIRGGPQPEAGSASPPARDMRRTLTMTHWPFVHTIFSSRPDLPRIGSLHQAGTAKAQMAIATDDDMIEHFDAQLFGRIQNLLCHVDIDARWRCVTRRVVVHEGLVCSPEPIPI